jgi:hypothetical protein
LDGGRGYAHFDGHVSSFWLVLGPVAALGAFRVKAARVYMLGAAIYFGFWAVSSQQLRFLIAMLPPLAIAAACSIEFALQRTAAGVRTVLRVVIVACGVIVLIPALVPTLTSGLSNARELWRQGPEEPSAFVPWGYRYINAKTPPDSKVLLLNTNHGFFLEREYIADSFFEASQMSTLLHQADSPATLRELLRGLGVSHIYVAHVDWHIHYPAVLDALLGDEQWSRAAYRCPQDSCVLYELRGPI